MIKPKFIVFPKYMSKATITTTNYRVLDKVVTSCKSTEGDLISGNYTLDMTILIDDSGLWKNIAEENILKVLCDYGYEYFYITKVQQQIRYITITARQLTIDHCMGLYLEDVRPTNTSGQSALTNLLSKANGTKEIELVSDIETNGTAYYENKTLYEALWSADNSFINVWGGETQRRGYTVTINSKLGTDRNVTLMERKNLKGFEGTTNIDEVYQKVRGKGFNGITGNWIKSDNADDYKIIRCKTFEYKVRVITENDDTNNLDSNYEWFKTKDEAIARLDELAKLEFTKNKVNELTGTYNIDFIQLEQTVEYQEYAVAEKCYMGDTVRVYIPRIGVDIELRVVKRVFNHLTQRVEEMTLSSYATTGGAVSISNIIKSIETIATNQESALEKAKQAASILIKSGMINSYVLVRNNEILIMNTKDINTATKVWRWNNNGLGYSSTGYNGTYKTAITADGKIVADMMNTGTLSAINIQNLTKTFVMDLSSGDGAQFYNNNLLAMAMSGNSLKFYNWGKEGDYIGSIGSTNTIDSSHPNGNPNKPNIAIWNDLDSSVAIQYATKSGINSSYIKFDKYKVQDNTEVPINIYEDTKVNAQLHMGSYLKMHNWKIFLSDDMKAFLWCTTVNNSVMAVYANELYVPGTVWAGNTGTAGADYAEMFEWLDGNTENEDRIGYLVSLEGDKIVKANGTDVLGIISGTASVLGDLAPEWQNKYLKDKWGRYLLDDEGNKIISPDYDESKEYLDRSSRNEWGVVGLVGKIFTRQDGSLSVGDYVQAINGIATKSTEKTNIRVINIIDDETVKVFIR